MKQDRAPRAVWAAACSLLCLLTAATMMRNTIWRDEVHFWQDVISKSPLNSRAYDHLGVAYHKQTDYARAFENYSRAIAMDPYLSINPYRNLALLYADAGEYDKAIGVLTTALTIDAKDYELYAARGLAFYRKEAFRQAIEDYSRSAALKPEKASIYWERGMAYEGAGETARALRDYGEACRRGHGSACDKMRERQ